MLYGLLIYLSFGLYLHISQVREFHVNINPKASLKTKSLAHLGFLVYCLTLDPLRWLGALVISKLKELKGRPDA